VNLVHAVSRDGRAVPRHRHGSWVPAVWDRADDYRFRVEADPQGARALRRTIGLNLAPQAVIKVDEPSVEPSPVRCWRESCRALGSADFGVKRSSSTRKINPSRFTRDLNAFSPRPFSRCAPRGVDTLRRSTEQRFDVPYIPAEEALEASRLNPQSQLSYNQRTGTQFDAGPALDSSADFDSGRT